jgi:hypothetical protein
VTGSRPHCIHWVRVYFPVEGGRGRIKWLGLKLTTHLHFVPRLLCFNMLYVVDIEKFIFSYVRSRCSVFMHHCWAVLRFQGTLGLVDEGNYLKYQGKALRLCLFMYSRKLQYTTFLYCCLTVCSHLIGL